MIKCNIVQWALKKVTFALNLHVRWNLVIPSCQNVFNVLYIFLLPGQFSQAYDKRQPYDTDIRVPLLIRGPGILEGGTPPYPIMNIDLAPTILQLAGLKPPVDMDGVPIKIFSNPELQQFNMLETNDVNFDEPYDRRMLVEYSGEGSEGSPDCPWGKDKNLFVS